MIPCILQDKTNFVEPYLDGFPELQRELLEILDTLCAPNAHIGEFLTLVCIIFVKIFFLINDYIYIVFY